MKLIFSFFFLSFLGFLDNTYLTIEHYKNAIPPCTIAHGCETVLTSRFSTISGIPISILGILFYLFSIGLVVLYLDTKRTLFLKFLLILTSISLIVSLVLVGIQAFVLHAFCQYCLTSEGINIVLFVLSVSWLKRVKQI